MASCAKKRKYLDDYIKYGFTVISKNGIEMPQCVICYKTLSNDAMRPSRLERHLSTVHPDLVNKPKGYFDGKSISLKRVKLDRDGDFRQGLKKVVEASYEISLLIVRAKKPHNVGETLVKPCILSAAKLVLGEDSYQKLSEISLSDSTVKLRIDEMADDIKTQMLEKVRSSPFFAIQCDETTDVSQCSQLLVYVRFIGNGILEEEMMLCCPLETTAKADDVLAVVSTFFEENNLSWDRLVGVCTDGAPAMLGSRSGFVTKIKQKSPSAVGTHCVIHREALAARTLPVELMNSLNSVIKIVNFIKCGALNTRLFARLCHAIGADHEALLFHTNVRWLSKGNMLERFYELKDEVKLFLEDQKKFDLLAILHSEEFELSLAYLVDIFQALNKLNRQLQGRNINIICHYDAIRSFIAKLHLWKRRISDRNTGPFPHLDEALKDKLLDDDHQQLIQTHL